MIECALLVELQKRDLALIELDQKVQQQHHRVEKLVAEVKKEEDLLKNKEALLKKITLRKKKNETELNEATEKNKLTEVKMKRAGIPPEAYMALDREMKVLATSISKLETEVLEDMEKLEMLSKDVEKGAKVLIGRREQVEEVKRKAHDIIVGLKQEKDREETERRQASLKVPGTTLEQYEELFRKNKGQIIWEAAKASCPSCGMSLPQGFMTAFMGLAATQAEQCPNCSLFLRWTGIKDGVHL